MLNQETSISEIMPAMPVSTLVADNLKSTKDFDKSLGERVKLMRKLRSISQDRLAKELGLTFQQAQKYESGANRFPIARLVAIAKILDCKVAFLIGEQRGDVPEDPLIAHLAARPDILKLLPKLTAMSSEQVNSFIRFLAATPTPETEDA